MPWMPLTATCLAPAASAIVREFGRSIILRFGRVAVCLLPTLAAAQTTTLTALERDHEARGWEAVGRLDTGDGFCSATLIAPDLVLSAAHCVYDRAGRPLAPDRITFRAGLRNGLAAATRGISLVAAHPGFSPHGDFSARNIAHDLALLELDTPIPSHEIDPFALHDEAVRSGPVSVVSYGEGRADLQSRQRECHLLQRQGDVLLFDCDVTFGSSGAPVFSHLNGRGRILSVISGRASLEDGRQISVGPHLPELVASLKRDLRQGTSRPAADIRRLRVGEAGASGAKFVRAN